LGGPFFVEVCVAVLYRDITGTINDAQGTALASGTLSALATTPIVDGTIFLAPKEVVVDITAGTFTLQLAAGAYYDFQVMGVDGEVYWSFQAPLTDESAGEISIAELYLISVAGDTIDPEMEFLTRWLSLTDTPESFVGQANRSVVVNNTEDALEFVPAVAGDEFLKLTNPLNGATLYGVTDNAAVPTATILSLSESAADFDGPVTLDSVQFDLSAGVSVGLGEMAWNDTDKTINLGVGVPTLQIGQEMMMRVHNNTGLDISNGAVVSISGVTNGRVNGVLGDANDRSSARGVVGLATEAIANGQEGMITTEGLVRDVNTVGYTPGDPVFLHASVPGTYQGAPPPFPPLSVVFIGVVVVADEFNGVIWVQVNAPSQLTELVDVSVGVPDTGELLVYNASTNVFENKVPSFTYGLSFDTYVPKATRGKVIHQHGGIEPILTGGAVSSGSPQAFTNGQSKVFIVVNAGSDVTGSLTITGDSVDRSTGIRTIGDTEVMAIDGLTTDGTTTDAAGNTVWTFTNAYISGKWWLNGCSFSTTDTDISDFDIYSVAFEQFGDQPNVVLEGVDISANPINSNAWVYGYLYSLIVPSGNVCNITVEAGGGLPASEITANRLYRMKRAELDVALDGTTDGAWAELHFGPFNQTYWEDINVKVWARITETLVLT